MAFSEWIINKISAHLESDIYRKHYHLCDYQRIANAVKPGDVILVEGCNKISKIIRRLTASPWTHAVLYIGRAYDIKHPKLKKQLKKYYKGRLDVPLVVESILGRGTVAIPFSHYSGDHLRICRPRGISEADTHRVIEYALNALGKDYNIRHFVDLGRFLLGSRFIPRRWRSTLFTKDPSQATKDICSVVIAEAFASVRFPILPKIHIETKNKRVKLIQRNPKLFTPCDFDYSPYFDIIKYPLVDFNGKDNYAKLPWAEGVISHDEMVVAEEPIVIGDTGKIGAKKTPKKLGFLKERR